MQDKDIITTELYRKCKRTLSGRPTNRKRNKREKCSHLTHYLI